MSGRVIHLLRSGARVECGARSWDYANSVRAATTCQRCLRRLEVIERAEAEAAADTAQTKRFQVAADALGVRHVWDLLDDSTPSLRLMRNVFGAVVLGLAEEQAATREQVA